MDRKQDIKILQSCPFCKIEKMTTKSGMTAHIKYCVKNPNRVIYKGHSVDDETRKRISDSLKVAIREGRASGWHKRKKGAQSYPEKWMTSVIQNEFDDKDFVDELHIGKYRLDFAWPHKMLYIEIDGQQHNFEDRKKSDIEKDAFCKKLGWTSMRLQWSYICQNKQKAISEMKDFIDNGKLSLIVWESPKEKLKREVAARKLERQKDNEARKELILNSGVDFNSWGWKTKIAAILGISRKCATSWIKRNMPDLYKQSRK